MKRKRIVVIGGGTGTYTALVGLKKYPVDLSVIVTMTDSGGSNRVIRDEFGLLPTSDIRQCMVALASEKKANEVLRKLFTYRYSQGKGISGMTFGNLFMAALTDIYGSQEKAIDATCEILNVQGQIIPVTYDNVNLVARYENGVEVVGEHFIDEPEAKNAQSRISALGLFPKAKANVKAVNAIMEADLVVLGPGDLFTSILCNLVVDGISKAITSSRAKKVYVLNLMTRFGQTDGFSAKDHLKEVEKYLEKSAVDVVLVNDSNGFPKGVLERYAKESAFPVKDDLNGSDKVKVIRDNFVSKNVYEKAKGDDLVRSLIRHDSEKLAKAIISLL
ncbi:YvcK family protein [Candidatus Woesebacteria bacterium]|nr:YvcK family protein [Candidatus Woesebacteria bacterium]